MPQGKQCSEVSLRNLTAFEPALSQGISECVERDALSDLLLLLSGQGLGRSDFGRILTFSQEEEKKKKTKGCCCCACCPGNKPVNPHKGNDFRTIVHLCIYFQAANIFTHLADNEPALLLTEDTEDSNLLHSLAKARVMTELHSSDCLDKFATFETLVIERLAMVVDPSSANSLNTLLTLCRAENARGLRPLEFAMNAGAFVTFAKLAEVDGYLVTKRSRQGASLHTTYDLSEYDLATGDRGDRSPILMLTLLPADRVDSLVSSGLTDRPLLRRWGRRTRADLLPLLCIRVGLFAFLTLMVSPLTPYFPFIATMVQYGFELNEGFYLYAGFVNATLGNATKSVLARACVGHNVLQFLQDSRYLGAQIVKTSPIFWFQSLTRATMVGQIYYSIAIIGCLLLLQLFAISLNGLERRRFNRQPWIQRHEGESYVQCSFYSTAYHMAFFFGVMYITFSLPLNSQLDCTTWLTKSEPNTILWFLSTASETTAVLYIFCSMVSLMEAFEMIGERVAFLNICFRKMCSRFLRVLPLFFIWAYIVFGTVMYMVDFKKSEFLAPTYVYYSPLRTLLDMATLPSRPSTAILHTLFVLVVSINITNFLIAIVSNEFNQAARHFQLLYTLTKLNYLLLTWRRYGRVLKLWHRRPRKLIIDAVTIQLD